MEKIEHKNVYPLVEKSREQRLQLFDMTMRSKKGHFPSASSLLELTIALYYRVMTHDPTNPRAGERDKLMVSEGHAAIVQYPALADFGYFSGEELERFTRTNGILRQYADQSIPGIECSTGSLGHGIGRGAGFAIDAKRKEKDCLIFVVISDGEYWEGSVSESIRFAAHQKLNNLVAILNHNGISILGKIEDLQRQEPLVRKWEADGWYTQRINGHSYTEILNAFLAISDKNKNREHKDYYKPSVIIAKTAKGKGVKEFEKNPEKWHNRFPDEKSMGEYREELSVYEGDDLL